MFIFYKQKHDIYVVDLIPIEYKFDAKHTTKNWLIKERQRENFKTNEEFEIENKHIIAIFNQKKKKKKKKVKQQLSSCEK